MREARANEAEALAAIHEAAFGQPDEARLAARLLREARPLVSWVAEEASRPIGHVLFTEVAIEGGGKRPAAGALAPVGVLPLAQGRGLGSALIRAGIEACRPLGWELLFVLGNPSYYGRFGFRLAAPLGLHYASHDFDVAFQVQELRPGALAGAAGWVRYHPAFDTLV
ncbi:MAG: N-acetyltransferase [Myxococcota bacterium]